MRYRILTVVLFAALLALPAALAQTPASSTVQPAPPSTAAQWEHRGDLGLVHKDYAQASDAYLKASQLDPSNPVYLNKAGIAYQQQNRLDLAKRYYKQAIKQDPKYADAINNMGTVYYAQKKYKAAIHEYNKAIKMKPDASLYCNLGTAYFSRGMYPQMNDAYAQAVKLDPDIFEKTASSAPLQQMSPAERARYHYFVARTYASAGNNEKSLEFLGMALSEGYSDREAIRRDPAFAQLAKTAQFQQLLNNPPITTESSR